LLVAFKEYEEEAAEQKAEETDTHEVVSDATAQAALQAPIALLSAAFATPGGARSALQIARVLGRNLPLVLLLVMIAALMWPTGQGESAEAGPDDVARKPNGSDAFPSELRH